LNGRVAALEDASWSGCGGRRPGAVALELAERCSGRVELLTERLVAIEERSTNLSEASEALKAWPRRLESLSARLDGGRAELRAELRTAEAETSTHSARLQVMERRIESDEAEWRELGVRLADQATRAMAVSNVASVAEEAASQAASESLSLRRIVQHAESEFASTAAAEAAASSAAAVASAAADRAAPSVADAEEGRAALTRLESRMELAEARHRISLQDIRARVDDLGRRTSQACLEAVPSHGHNRPGAPEPAWKVPMRELERELKALLAAQVEDSAAALRSVAALVEDLASSKDSSVIRHSPQAPSPSMHSTPLRAIGNPWMP